MRGGCIPRSMQARNGSLINSVRSPKLPIGSIIIVLLRRGRRAERFCHPLQAVNSLSCSFAPNSCSRSTAVCTAKMPHGGARSGAGRPKGRKNATIREEVREIQRSLPTVIPPKLIVDGDEKDAAAQANDIMQHAGQMMRAYRALIDNTAAPQQSIADG